MYIEKFSNNIVFFPQIQCTLSDENLNSNPATGECDTSPPNWGSQCEKICADGYALGARVAQQSRGHLKCTGTTRPGAWKQRDYIHADPPPCRR